MTRRTKLRTCVLLVFFSQTLASASSAETLEARYHRAIAGLGQFRNNMNGLWFGFTSEHRYALEGSPRIREYQGVIFYSESMIYMAYLEFPESPERPRWRSQQTEAIISDRWVISTNHLFPSQTLAVDESSGTAYDMEASSQRRPIDVTKLFQERIVDFATQAFAKPRINANGQLVVRYSSGQTMREAGTAASPGLRMYDVIFSRDSEMRPIDNQLLKLLPNGEIEQLAFVDIRYGQTSAGKTVIRRIVSESRRELNDMPETYDIRIREIECPAWNTVPPRISATSNSISVLKYGTNGRRILDTDQLHPEVEDLIRRFEKTELKQQLDKQKKSLESIYAFVRADDVPPEPAPAVDSITQPAHTFPLATAVASVLGAIVLALAGFWIILWKRAYARRP